MFELGQNSQLMFLSFIDTIYKKNKFSSFIEPEQLYLLEKAMKKYLTNPTQLYEKLTSKRNPQHQNGKQTEYEKESSSVAHFIHRKKYESDSKSIEELLNEDIKNSQKQNKNEAMIFFQQSMSQSVLKKHIQPIKGQRGLLKVQNYHQSDEDSDFSFEETNRLSIQTRKLSQNHANIHFSGLYSDMKSKFRTTKKGQKLSIPLLIIKCRNSPKEYVIRGCRALLGRGAIEVLHSKLIQYESQPTF